MWRRQGEKPFCVGLRKQSLQKQSEKLPKPPLYAQVQEEMADLPVATEKDLEGIDGLIIGSPCHFGNMSAQSVY